MSTTNEQDKAAARPARRQMRSLEDLAARLAGEILPSAGDESATPSAAADSTHPGEAISTEKAVPAATRRTPPDLSTLFDDVPQAAATKSARPEEAPAPPSPARRAPRDLSALFEETPKPAVTAEPEGLKLKINPELAEYLPPDIWRRLNGVTVRRGVLFNAVERMRSQVFQLSTFLPTNLVQQKLAHPLPGLVKGEIVQGSLLFSDVSGFTALSERLAVLGPAGAERLTALMNKYFTAMVDRISQSGGSLIKFAGDATLVFFPAGKGKRHAAVAVRTGLRMLAAMSEFSNIETPAEKVSLKMKIGIASGDFLAASIGSAQRMEYALIGPTVSRVMAAEGASTAAGQLIVDENTAGLLSESDYACTPQRPGFYLVNPAANAHLDSFEIAPGASDRRQGRGGITWSADPQETLQEMEHLLLQIRALRPYIADELSGRVVANARHRVEGEFRPVVTMFCNFSGPETLYEGWGESGSARLTSVLSAYFSAMHDIIRRYEGVVTRIDPYSKGTKMLVLFGAPISHEDDPLRAISTALTMNMELELVNERLAQKYARFLSPNQKGPLIQHRIGLTYGEIFAGQVGAATRREYTVMGDDVNLAARLMGAGKPGQILLSPELYQAVSDHFQITPLNPIRVKGKSKPIPIYQVDGPAENILITRHQRRGQTIGRERELSKAHQALDEAINGACRLLILEGPAGMGKSHLADVLLAQAAERQARLLAAQCHSYTDATPYAAWSGMLRSLAGITALDHASAAYEKFQQMLHEHHITKEAYPLLGALMGIRPPEAAAPDASANDAYQTTQFFAGVKSGEGRRRGSTLEFLAQLERTQLNEAGQSWDVIHAPLVGMSRERTYQAVARLLRGAAAKHPLALFFEDAHWLDPASVDLLASLVEQLADSPLFFILAQRSGDERLAERGQVITLGPLTPAETYHLVAQILVSQLAPLIFQQTDGNPLFVEEITRWLQRARKMEAHELREVLNTSGVMQKLILSRVENLPEGPREVIRTASVIGIEFRISELQTLLQGALDPQTLSAHLRSLASSRLVVLQEAGVDARYAFQQALVCDILYNSLSFDKRRALHSTLADYLSAQAGAPTQPSGGRVERSALRSRIAAFLDAPSERKIEENALRIGGHYEKAERFYPAAEQFVRAGATARQRQASAAASDQNAAAQAAAAYQQALLAIDRLAPELLDAPARRLRYEILLTLADLAAERADYAQAATFLENARTSLAGFLLPTQQSTLALRLAVLLPAMGRADEAVNLLRPLVGSEICAENSLAQAIWAWLCWRTDMPLPALVTTEKDAQLAALWHELSGEYAAASEDYAQNSRPELAAFAAVRLGDEALARSDDDAAQECYARAAHFWAASPAGLALVAYRRAEAAARRRDTQTARHFLNQMLENLASTPPTLRQEGRSLLRQATRSLAPRRGQAAPPPWPAWRWFSVEDRLRAALFYSRLTRG